MDLENITETEYLIAKDNLSRLKVELKKVIIDKECNRKYQDVFNQLYDRQKEIRRKIARNMFIIKHYEDLEKKRREKDEKYKRR